MESTAYESKQAILEEAGFAFVVLAETLDGTANGSNKSFTTTNKPLIDANYDDALDATDVTAYVNGIAVLVGNVDSQSGRITLQTAPTNGATVTADYVWSPIKDGKVTEARNEAQDHINEVMSTLETVPYTNFTDDTPTPSTVRRITRHMAAALLLIPDYGSGSETDNTSKDGDKRWNRAEMWLQKYLDQGGLSGGSTDPYASFDARSDRPMFDDRGRARHGSLTPVDDDFIGDTDNEFGDFH